MLIQITRNGMLVKRVPDNIHRDKRTSLNLDAPREIYSYIFFDDI